VGLSLVVRKCNSIGVIVDRLIKYAHFIPVNTNYNVHKYAKIYIAHVLCLHRVSKLIISDRGSQFVAHFWEFLHVSLRTHLIHSLTYHPQTDGQTERVNQILEDMLRACEMENQGSWDKYHQLAEFSYNNNYQESLKMAPFVMLYGRRCRTPLNWIEPEEKVIFGPDLVDEAEAIVHHIQNNLRAMKSRQESYANKRVDHYSLRLEIT
jgi:hypothetical protein